VELEEKKSFPWPIAAGVIVVLLLLAGVYVLTQHTGRPQAVVEERLPFGASEQAYAQHIHFLGLKLSQATNFLNQEFTYVTGTISNDGDRTLRQVEVTLEFRDPFNQVVLRETRRVIDSHAQPLSGGERRDFTIALERLPAQWNQQFPSIRVTGLQLE
jgi:hypothetical protein